MPGSVFSLEVNPKIPAKLVRLSELANDLWYSWDRPTRELFFRLDPALWDAVGHNPKVFLRRVEEARLVEASQDRVFLESYYRILSAYDTYLLEPVRQHDQPTLGHDDLVAYFCAEFGFHESFPIYSGGLGILAGDHCKAASDLGIPFVAVGLLYRQGYFSQIIDGEGNQLASYTDSDFADLPVMPVLQDDGNEVKVEIELPGRVVMAKLWVARVGHIRLYLLDTDLPENSEEDRGITHRLYGGDINTRIKQEIVLGIGGVRALRAAGLHPTVWHINEGHAAFQILERARELVAQGLDFRAALEATAAATVFTTHTPVPAGHDIFPHELMLEYFRDFIPQLKLDTGAFLALGHKPAEGSGFNQTALAVRGSRYQNGVSRIHGGVSSRMMVDLWPQVPPDENPMTYVTNGVHIPTFLAQEWMDLFDSYLGGEWRNKLSDAAFWHRIDQIPDHLYWSVRQALKSQMINHVRERLSHQHRRNGGSEAHLDRLLRYLDPLDPSILMVGFARRFATYKRATLLFEDPERLRRIINHAERPVVFIFAGKAHPADRPGQDLIRNIHAIAHQPEFEGKVHMVEGYDMGLARALVYGVDVWLNNPEYPLEASGTSGEKAGINGTINLSVLDGWWGEGYDGHNGWAIKPLKTVDPFRARQEEANSLYELLEEQVIPLYYQAGKYGYSTEWVKKSKHSMKTLLPRFNAARMVGEYVNKFYRPAARQGLRVTAEDFRGAHALAQWKERVQVAWPGVGITRLDQAPARLQFGQQLRIELAVQLNGLQAEDVRVECLFRHHDDLLNREQPRSYLFRSEGEAEAGGAHRFVLNLEPETCGRIDYQIRIYPYHELLAHPHETGLMLWL
ncbi:MAG: alpha-glucan family phosphorylase [Pseudomonadota bacterium]